MKSEVLSKDACMEVKRLYELRDGRGRRVHSYRSLGQNFGVSESTIMRVVQNYGTFMDLPEPKSDAQLSADAAASLQRFMAAPAAVAAPAAAKPEPVDPVTGKPLKLPY